MLYIWGSTNSARNVPEAQQLISQASKIYAFSTLVIALIVNRAP